MAEAVAAIGLASALVQLLDFGSKVLRQLRELEQDVSGHQGIFQGVRTRLPLMLDLVQKIMLQIDLRLITTSTQQHMLPLIRSCTEQVEQLHRLISRVLPQGNESAWRRRGKAVLGALGEAELQRTDAGLKRNFDLLLQAGAFQSLNRPDQQGSSHPSSSFTLNPTVNVNVLHSDHTQRLASDDYPFYREPSPSSFDLKRLESHGASAVFMVPFQRDSNFLGRASVIKEVSQRFHTQRSVALAGLGGIGVRHFANYSGRSSKSQIAIEYSYIFREEHPDASVFWIYAGSGPRFEQGFCEIARKLSIPGWDDPRSDKLEIVYNWMCEEDSGEWLLILDNADDASMFFRHISDVTSLENQPGSTDAPGERVYARYLPHSPSGYILITTRDKRVGDRLTARQKPIEIGPMSQPDCVELLRSRILEDDWSEADGARLVRELSHLPLAITQAAAFISENCITVSEYLDMLYHGDPDIKELLSEHLEDSRRELDSENSVMRTWKMSFDQISRIMPRAADILSLMAVLDFHGPPRRLLRRKDETEMGFRTALGALQAFSLITVGRGKDATCKMHRLIGLATQKWLEVRGLLGFWHTEALKVLEDQFPETGWQTPEDWAALETLLPHTQLMFNYSFTTQDDLLCLASLLESCALYDMSKGKYEDSLKKSQRSLSIRVSFLAADHPDRLQSMQVLGESLLHCGDLQAAQGTLVSVIKDRERILGPLHADTLESLSDLTITLLEMDELDAAGETVQKAWTGREQALGAEDRDTLVSLNLYSILLQRQGKLEQALELTERALQGRKQLLGPGHPDTLLTMNNMARLHFERGDVTEAKSMLTAVLEGEARVLVAEGFDAQVTMTNMSLVLQAEHNFREAEMALRRVLSIRTRQHGPNHLSTELTHQHLANLALRRSDVEQFGSVLAGTEDKIRAQARTEAGALLCAGLLFD